MKLSVRKRTRFISAGKCGRLLHQGATGGRMSVPYCYFVIKKINASIIVIKDVIISSECKGNHEWNWAVVKCIFFFHRHKLKHGLVLRGILYGYWGGQYKFYKMLLCKYQVIFQSSIDIFLLFYVSALKRCWHFYTFTEK